MQTFVVVLTYLPLAIVLVGRLLFELIWRRTVAYRTWMSYPESDREYWMVKVREQRRKDANLAVLDSVPTAFLLASRVRMNVVSLVQSVETVIVTGSLLLAAGGFGVISFLGIAVLVGELVNYAHRHRIMDALDVVLGQRRAERAQLRGDFEPLFGDHDHC